MTYIPLPDGEGLSFYLAAEDYVARHWAPADDCLLTWQVGPSVICGRNQDVAAEVDLAYCREAGISVFRRKSGGGAVYADSGNVMITFIAPSDQVNFTYHRFVEMLLLLLRRIGVEATHSGRNDILVEGRKVSGTAFYKLPHHSIVHSTMLFDTDATNMSAALTPSKDKLQRHGVGSVHQRITLLREHTSASPADLRRLAQTSLCTSERQLNEEDFRNIRKKEKEYIIQIP